MTTIVEQFDIETMQGTFPMMVVKDHVGFFAIPASEPYPRHEDSYVAEAYGIGFLSEEGPELPKFTASNLAKQHEKLAAEYLDIGADIQAFHAPPECHVLACQAFERQHAAELAMLKEHCLNYNFMASPII